MIEVSEDSGYGNLSRVDVKINPESTIFLHVLPCKKKELIAFVLQE